MSKLSMVGYFSLFWLSYLFNTLVIAGPMLLLGVTVVVDVFFAAGVLTVVEGIILAIISYHQSEVQKVQLRLDDEYRKELLEHASEN